MENGENSQGDRTHHEAKAQESERAGLGKSQWRPHIEPHNNQRQGDASLLHWRTINQKQPRGQAKRVDNSADTGEPQRLQLQGVYQALVQADEGGVEIEITHCRTPRSGEAPRSPRC